MNNGSKDRSRNYKKFRLVSLFFFLFLQVPQVFAAALYQFNQDERIKAEISSKEMTRIEFGKYSISGVVGDENKYQIIHDESASSIFIKPKVPVGSKFSISLISLCGIVADLDLTVRDKEVGAIIIKMNTLENKQDARKFLDHEIAAILKAMKKGEKGKYFVEEVNQKVDLTALTKYLGSKAILTKKQIYRFGNITGVILNLKNNENKEILLKEDYFKNIFENTSAALLETDILPKRASTAIFVVCKESEDNE